MDQDYSSDVHAEQPCRGREIGQPGESELMKIEGQHMSVHKGCH